MGRASIKAQAKEAIKSNYASEVEEVKNEKLLNGGKGADGKVQHSVAEAGVKFIEVLRDVIARHAGTEYSSGDLGKTAVAVAQNLSAGAPRKKGNKYYIDIKFSSELHRDSLRPEAYDGIDDIVALLNNGYSTDGRPIKGFWHDKEIWALQTRTGAHFIQEAKEEFMSHYAAEYGVVDINLGKYE